MAVKKKDVTALFASFEQEIARLEAKRHLTEDDLSRLNGGIRALEKQEAQIQSHLKQMLSKGSDMDVKRLTIKDKLNRQSNKLDKLRKLYDELKAV